MSASVLPAGPIVRPNAAPPGRALRLTLRLACPLPIPFVLSPPAAPAARNG